jgi:indolepyruvate ferredoxin oxidoreductase
MGAHRRGGVLVCVGDDPQAKSSSVPSTSEPALYSLAMPIMAPADPQEILDLGRHGFALSRLCGLWVGMRIPASVADCTLSVEVSAQRVRPVEPNLVVDGTPFAHQVSAQLLGAKLIELESSLYGPRIEIARRYARANALNQVTARGANDVLGIAAAGPAYLSVVRALRCVGLGTDDLAEAGVRLLKVSMPFPLDEGLIQEFAAGLEEILVVEDKRAFLETLIKGALYRVEGAPVIVGKVDEEGRVLVPATGEVDPDALVGVIASRLLRRRAIGSVQRWTERTRPVSPEPLSIVRGAYFCSGCPHNTSVRVPEGAIVGSGSGCHGLAIQMDTRQVGTVVGRFQMGGEGAMWNGMAPFVSTAHFFQNLGDGTLAHSGSLAIRAAVASKVNITFKLLVNDTVAMTGGQPIAGGRGTDDLVRQLLAEGVRRIIITSDEPRRNRVKGLPRGVDVWPRRRLVEAQSLLADTPGVTVLLHHQECAAELRRKRKRGLVATPPERVHVNTRLCERCGDCGTASNCLSVRSVETPFGTKTQIHQESCNLDLSCLNGRCPALVTVRTSSTSAQPARAVSAPLAAADPQLRVARDTFTIRLTGIGGTGVLTVAQIVAMAAHLEGRFVRELDQTGIAQKGGAVVSDLRLSTTAELTTARLGEEECDLYLGCDVLVAATSPNLMVASPQRTVAVTSTATVPIGRQIADSSIASPPLDVMRARIDARSRSELNVWMDAPRLAQERLGSDGYANVLLLGAAYQAGALPLSSASIEQAIELNGVDVEANRLAFRWGRHEVASRLDPGPPPGSAPEALVARDARIESIAATVGATSGGELDDLVRTRVADLADYQDREYAREYARVLVLARAADQALGRGDGPFSRAVAVELHRLMSYKDEYEVARLHLSRGARDELEGAFGAKRRVTYHLMPPSLGWLGLKRKLRLRLSATWGFHALRAARRLRGTSLDPFGRSAERREERRVRDDYVATVEHLSKTLRADTYEFALEVANLPSEIRGFGEIKSLAIQRYEERRRDLLSTTVPTH